MMRTLLAIILVLIAAVAFAQTPDPVPTPPAWTPTTDCSACTQAAPCSIIYMTSDGLTTCTGETYCLDGAWVNTWTGCSPVSSTKP